MDNGPSLRIIKKRKERERRVQEEEKIHTYRIQQLLLRHSHFVFSFFFFFFNTHSQEKLQTNSSKLFQRENTWLNPGHLSAWLPFGDKGEKVGEVEGEEKDYWARGGGQVVGGGPTGCYFLALADLAEFRGGVTGLPDPIPPPPP